MEVTMKDMLGFDFTELKDRIIYGKRVLKRKNEPITQDYISLVNNMDKVSVEILQGCNVAHTGVHLDLGNYRETLPGNKVWDYIRSKFRNSVEGLVYNFDQMPVTLIHRKRKNKNHLLILAGLSGMSDIQWDIDIRER